MVFEDKTNSSYFTKGHIPNNKGKTGLYHHTDKTKKILSQINIGRINSRETRIKISKTHKEY